MATQRTRSRIVIIGLSILLMAATVLILGTILQAGQETADLTGVTGSSSPSTAVDPDPLQQSEQARAFLEVAPTGADPRQLETYWARRAYQGAPPIIPHAILNEQDIGGDSCLQCHETGTYSPQFEAYAPIVPHPELISCRQCHVGVNTTDVFVESDWQPLTAPEIHLSVLPGSPPRIPHDLNMRESCLDCHAGPAVPTEIRVTHPERLSCQQCHVLILTNEEWSR